MTEKISFELGPIQETLLIPLLGRAEETKKGSGLIHDDKAVEIVDVLDYDFSKWLGIPSLSAASVRTRMFDDEVRDFLSEHPAGTIVEIGAGLNTRYERLDNGKATWLEIDLPDSMALRQRFFDNTERRTMLSASVTESNWYENVLTCPAPYCFVTEAVIIYLENGEVEQAIRSMAEAFPGAWLITDTTATSLVENQHKHDAMKYMPKASWFRWRCDDPASLSEWELHHHHAKTFMDASPKVKACMPFKYRLMIRFVPWLVRRMLNGYYINRFEFKS